MTPENPLVPRQSSPRGTQAEDCGPDCQWCEDLGESMRAQCRYAGCTESPECTLEIPTFTPGLRPITGRYCNEHADEILGEPMVFPGAREISAHA